MLKVTPEIEIDDRELDEEFVRASGPGGQNVNKVSTAVQLRFNVLTSQSLPPAVQARLMKLAANRINSEGELVITAQAFRTQARNRVDARERLVSLIRTASHKPRPRYKTRPTLASRRKRLEAKRRQGERKRTRTKAQVID